MGIHMNSIIWERESGRMEGRVLEQKYLFFSNGDDNDDGFFPFRFIFNVPNCKPMSRGLISILCCIAKLLP